MIAPRAVLAGFALALAPAVASDNSKSRIDPNTLLRQNGGGSNSNDGQSPINIQYTSAPNPNDTAYVDELNQQLVLQQAQVQEAQAALAAAQAQLALALQGVGGTTTGQQHPWATITAVWNFQATQGTVEQSSSARRRQGPVGVGATGFDATTAG